MIRSILFDLDRTLLDRDKSFHHFANSQYELFSQALSHLPQEVYVARLTELDDRGRVWKDAVYQTAVEEFNLQGVSWRELYQDFESRISDYYVPFPGLRETFDNLKSNGYQLGLVSNGRHDFQMRSIRTLGIEQDFKVILISESTGIRKPDPAIFNLALQALDCKSSDCVFVGDHPETDIKGAHDVGMKTIWKRNEDFSQPVQADAVFDDLEQLPAIICRL